MDAMFVLFLKLLVLIPVFLLLLQLVVNIIFNSWFAAKLRFLQQAQQGNSTVREGNDAKQIRQ